MGWQERTSMMSPAQEREFWLKEVKNRMEWGGLLVNRRYMPSLDRTPVLRKLVEDGKLIRVREVSWGGSYVRRTFLRVPEQQA